MLRTFLDCIFGSCTVKCKGRFPERLINIASNKGIYIQNVYKTEDGELIFTVSKNGLSLLKKDIPDGLEVTCINFFGLPYFWKRYKKRIVLICFPVFFILTTVLFSSFIWQIKITGGDKKLQTQTLSALRNNGVYKGALKYKIEQNDVKYKTIVSVDELSWMWVDIKGVTAYVSIRPRTIEPHIFEIKEPGDVIATESGIVEKAEVYCGRPLITEGATIEKGDLLVTGVISTENENIPTYYHHARAKVITRTWKEKIFNIPKKNYVKKQTGKKKSVYCVNFKKNNIKFSLNSGISYKEYDKIINKFKLPLLPVTFIKEVYYELDVSVEDNNIKKDISGYISEYKDELKKKGYDVVSVKYEKNENEENIKLAVTAECLFDAAKEVPIMLTDEGEADGKNS